MKKKAAVLEIFGVLITMDIDTRKNKISRTAVGLVDVIAKKSKTPRHRIEIIKNIIAEESSGNFFWTLWLFNFRPLNVELLAGE